jgi:hypothetical protein
MRCASALVPVETPAGGRADRQMWDVRVRVDVHVDEQRVGIVHAS